MIIFRLFIYGGGAGNKFVLFCGVPCVFVCVASFLL